jgi:tripartite-type tricarboxylate transporter receptor subunit TctC
MSLISHQRPARAAGAALLLTLLPGVSAAQETVEAFYKGRTITALIAGTPGGGFDLATRTMGEFLGKYLPGNPKIQAQNMPGGGGLVAANHLYNVAPKDGTVFGSFSRNFASQAVLGRDTIKADPRKYSWIGGSSLPSRVCVVNASSPAKTFDDVFKVEVIVGGSGAGSSLSIVPAVLNNVLGTKFRVVEGYKGSTDAVLAMERGETAGICHTFSSFRNAHADLLSEGKVRILLHAEEAAFPYASNVPSVYDYAKTEEQKQLMRFAFSSVEFGRPYVAPPGVPKDRVAALRKAFAATLADPELKAESEKLKLDMTFRPPEDLEKLVAQLYATPKDLLARAQELMPSAD